MLGFSITKRGLCVRIVAPLSTITRPRLVQTATSDVLKVISRSDADLEAVLENLVETATRLCQADHGYVFRRHGEHHHLIASFGVDPDFRNYMIANPFLPDRGTLSGRVALERQIVHIDDAATDVEYTWSEAQH